MVEEEDGRCVAAMDLKVEHTNSFGIIHGGVIFTLADRAFGYVSNRGEGEFVTLDMQIRYLRPALPGQRLLAEARLLHSGRSTRFVSIEVRTGENKVIAHLTGTAHLFERRETGPAQDAGTKAK